MLKRKQERPTEADLLRLYQSLTLVVANQYVVQELIRSGRFGGEVKRRLQLTARSGRALMTALKSQDAEAFEKFEGYVADNMALVLDQVNKATQVPPDKVDWFVAQTDKLIKEC